MFIKFIKIFLISFLVNIFFVNLSFSESINPYNGEYYFFKNQADYKQIGKNVGLVLGASVVGVGILFALPESFTNWDKSDLKDGSIFHKYGNHIRSGPVWDEDDWFLNWITHPYWGAAYYMSARSAGASAPYSFIFSALASTFFWEYGVEAFAEIPSKQDLLITPIVGSVFGEVFYLAKRHIYKNNYKLLNSKILGYSTVFIMDPITEFFALFSKKKKINSDIQTLSFFTYDNKQNNLHYNMGFAIKF